MTKKREFYLLFVQQKLHYVYFFLQNIRLLQSIENRNTRFLPGSQVGTGWLQSTPSESDVCVQTERLDPTRV